MTKATFAAIEKAVELANDCFEEFGFSTGISEDQYGETSPVLTALADYIQEVSDSVERSWSFASPGREMDALQNLVVDSGDELAEILWRFDDWDGTKRGFGDFVRDAIAQAGYKLVKDEGS